MDERLLFEQHISKMVRRCYCRLEIFYCISQYLNEDLRIKLCDTLLLSILGYANVVYAMQNSCARSVLTYLS